MGEFQMSDSKKSFADKLHEKSQIAKDVMTRGAQVVADGAQKGGAAVAQGAHIVADGAQKSGAALAQGAHKGGEALVQGAHKGADALAQGAEKGGKVVAQGAKIAGVGAKKGVQFVKEHPKETAVIAGAAVVAAGALPFTPFGVPAALAVVGAAAQGAKATQDALRSCGSEDATAGDGHSPGALGLIAAVEAGATVAETTMSKLDAAKTPKKK